MLADWCRDAASYPLCPGGLLHNEEMAMSLCYNEATEECVWSQALGGDI